MGYTKKTSNYSERIVLSTPTHMMSIVDLIAIIAETPKIDSGFSLDKEFSKLIYMNP